MNQNTPANEYVRAMAYELARELISGEIARLSHMIGVEEGRQRPTDGAVVAFERAMFDFARERESLDPNDHEAVLAVIERYRRPNRNYADASSLLHGVA